MMPYCRLRPDIDLRLTALRRKHILCHANRAGRNRPLPCSAPATNTLLGRKCERIWPGAIPSWKTRTRLSLACTRVGQV